MEEWAEVNFCVVEINDRVRRLSSRRCSLCVCVHLVIRGAQHSSAEIKFPELTLTISITSGHIHAGRHAHRGKAEWQERKLPWLHFHSQKISALTECQPLISQLLLILANPVQSICTPIMSSFHLSFRSLKKVSLVGSIERFGANFLLSNHPLRFSLQMLMDLLDFFPVVLAANPFGSEVSDVGKPSLFQLLPWQNSSRPWNLFLFPLQQSEPLLVLQLWTRGF